MNLLAAINRFTPEARKGMAILAAAVVAALAVAYVIIAWHGAVAEQLRQATAEHELVAARAAKAASEGATRLVEADQVAPMFLEGETPGLAFARFQSIVGEVAGSAGLAVKRMQPVDTGDAGASMPYRLSVDVEGSIEQLRDFLVHVEAALPVMFVTGFEIQPAAAAGEAVGVAGAADGQYPSEALRATLRIEAFGWRAP